MAEFIWPLRVYYEDTDHGGVVYHANFVKFMERARTEWLRVRGVEQDSLSEEQGVVFAIRDMQLKFHLPARFNDALEVSVEMVRCGRASADFYQQVCRAGEILCEGTIRVASLETTSFKPKMMNEALLIKMAEE
ncbi:MAG: tol-pal system-associated acyl-CoA thioesterase [Pseudomonadota bacterium]